MEAISNFTLKYLTKTIKFNLNFELNPAKFLGLQAALRLFPLLPLLGIDDRDRRHVDHFVYTGP